MRLFLKKNVWLFAWFCILQVPAFSQVTDEERNFYFDDDNISSSRNIIKTDLWSLAHREVSVSWEHYYAGKVSFEAGVGYMTPGYVYSYWPRLLNGYYSNIDSPGYSLSLQNRFYVIHGFKSPYVHIGVKYRSFSNLTSMDYFTGLGWQVLVGNRLKIDAGFGLGLRKQHSSDGKTFAFDPDWDGTNIDFPVFLKIGYLLSR